MHWKWIGSARAESPRDWAEFRVRGLKSNPKEDSPNDPKKTRPQPHWRVTRPGATHLNSQTFTWQGFWNFWWNHDNLWKLCLAWFLQIRRVAPAIKTEFIHLNTFPTRATAHTAIAEWIEVFYNRQRLHSSLNFLSPAQFEEHYYCFFNKIMTSIFYTDDSHIRDFSCQ